MQRKTSAYLRSLPEMTVLSPGDDWEAGECTKAAAQVAGPCYLRLDKGSVVGVQQSSEPFAIGRARRLREGRDATLVATGSILPVVLDAADRLAKNGVKCRVLSMPTVKPLDIESLADAAEDTGGIFTVEEHTIDGGLGGPWRRTFSNGASCRGYSTASGYAAASQRSSVRKLTCARRIALTRNRSRKKCRHFSRPVVRAYSRAA